MTPGEAGNPYPKEPTNLGDAVGDYLLHLLAWRLITDQQAIETVEND